MTAPGPLGDEARMLVDAARDWVARTFPEVETHLATGSAECTWCPLCRGVAALRDPELSDRIAAAVTTVAGTLAAVLDAATRPPEPNPDGTANPDPDRPVPEPAATVDPIPLDGD